MDKSNVIILKNKSIRKKMEYIKSLFRPERKVVVVINTPYKAWQLLTYFKNENDIINNAEVFYNVDSIPKNHSDNIIMITLLPYLIMRILMILYFMIHLLVLIV